MTTLGFVDWRRSEITAMAAPTPQGYLQATLTPRLRDGSAGAEDHGLLHVTLRSAADLAAVSPAAIRHRAPAPNANDAEDTKWTHIDFHAPDFPWRYSPVAPDPAGLPPWLVLLVGDDDEVDLDRGGLRYGEKTRRLLSHPAHDLARSPLCAHVQVPLAADGTEVDEDTAAGTPTASRFSRLLNLRKLEPMTHYTALLVPAFNDGGKPMWQGGVVANANRPIPVFDTWSFTTGEGGDFETLAAALHIADDERIGRARVSYIRAAGPIGGPMATRGALSALGTDDDTDPDVLTRIAENLHTLTDIESPAGRPQTLGLPRYGVPWIDADDTGTVWAEQFHADPRDRLHAGTGARMGVAGQEELMRAAVEQAGALAEANGLVSRMAAGLHLSGLGWARELPADGGARAGVFAAMTSRMRAADGQTVAAAITDETLLSRALLSGAGQRLLSRATRSRRPGPTADEARDHLTSEREDEPALPGSAAALGEAIIEEVWGGAGGDWAVAKVLERVSEESHRILRAIPGAWKDPREREAASAEIARAMIDTFPHVDGYEQRKGEVWREICEVTGCRDGQTGPVFEDFLAAWPVAARAVADRAIDAYLFGPIQGALLRCLFGCEYPNGLPDGRPAEREDECERRIRNAMVAAPDPARPVSMPALGAAISAVLDPRSDDAPARVRLRTRIPNLDLTTLAPPRFPLGLDFPTWSLLREHDKDWLLPGASEVEDDSVTALRTNPAFIDAYLLGLNTQFHAETRWRGISVDPWGTPLGMFFGPVDPYTGARARDIRPIDTWPATSRLGDRSHQATRPSPTSGDAAERLVILLHTPLFRRYPRTVIYLHKGDGKKEDLEKQPALIAPDLRKPDGTVDEGALADWMRTRVDIAPSFTGSITPDLVFFGFDLAPEALDDYWLMLDEPPAETRFGPRKKPAGAGFLTDTEVFALGTSGKLAVDRIDRPARVAISGAHLARAGGGTP